MDFDRIGVEGLEFRVLGALDIRRGDRRFRVDRDKHRALLAGLLLNTNQVVPVERLIDYLWDTDPPATAVKAVRVYVGQLRRLLAGADAGGEGAVRLETRPGGYLLEIDAEWLDAVRFERLVETARRLELADGKRVELLREALGLWRGPALADVASPVLRRTHAVQLEDARLVALEERIEAELAMGADGALTGELSALVAEHPLRERFRAQLMLALYRAGRRGDALAAYRATRAQLSEWLGLEPGPALQRLERAILADDPTLALPQRDASPAERQIRLPAPAQLPPDVSDFTGRAVQVRQLEHVLGDDRTAAGRRTVTVAAVAGSAGVGKTALAVHVAHRLRERYPDGQLYVNLHGVEAQPIPPEQALAGFLHALGVTGQAVPATLEGRVALYRSLLADRRMLVVLDNAAGPAQVRPLVPSGHGCAVLVTSRARLAGLESATILELEVLEPDEAVALLATLAGAARVAADPEATADVVSACGRLPLALRIAGARLAARTAWSVRDLARRLADQRGRLDELRADDVGVRAGFEVSYRALTGESASPGKPATLARAFRLLSLPDGPDISLRAAARLLDQPIAHAETVLERLVDQHLLDSPAPGRYRFHDLLKLFARERAEAEEPESDRHNAKERLVGFYSASTRYAELLLLPGVRALHEQPAGAWGALTFEDRDRALAWLEAERANLVAAVLQSAAEPDTPAAIPGQLAVSVGTFLDLRGYWHDWERTSLAALAAADRDGDVRAQVFVEVALGGIAWRRHRLDEARGRLERATRLSVEADDPWLESIALHVLGITYSLLGWLKDAADCHRRSLGIAQRLGDQRIEAVSYLNLGECHRRAGRYGEALAAYQRHLDACADLGDQRGESIGLSAIGQALRGLQRYDEAIVYHERGLGLVRALDDRWGQSRILLHLGVALRLAGRPSESAERCQESLDILRELGQLHGQGEALWRLGEALRDQGVPDEARDCWLEAEALFASLGAPEAEHVLALLTEASHS